MTHLIFIEGLPGSGKSESARHLAANLEAQGYKTKVFLETDPTNPLHTAALDPQGAAFADAHIRFNIEGFAHQSLQKYEDLRYSLRENTTTVFESFPMQSHVRVLMQMDASSDFIDKFWDDVQAALQPLAPALVYFEEHEPESALRRIVEIRGAQWGQYISAALEQSPYATSRNLKGLDGVIKLMCDYNALTQKLFASWRMNKLLLPARPADYAKRDAAILNSFTN